MKLSIFALVFSAVAGQPPHNPGQWVTSPDLPGMPIEITDSRDNDGQFCGRICNARADCYGFNYAPYGCTVDPGTKCNLNGGCCWLKASASSDKIITSVPNCAASFIMRPAAGSVNASEPAAVAPPVKPPRQLGAGVKNVLYILVDDLRPDVAPYGQNFMLTPGIQALANNGTTFDRSYCTIAVCSPSRMSFLTGRYPATTRVWNFLNHFRQADCQELPGQVYRPAKTPYQQINVLDGGAGQCCSSCTADDKCTGWTHHPKQGLCLLYNDVTASDLVAGVGVSGGRGVLIRRNWTSLPQHFKNAGFLAQSSGKIFHTEEGGMGPAPWDGPGSGMPPLQDPPSWSPGNSSMYCVNALAPMRPCTTANPPADDTCSVPGSDLDGNVPPGTHTFEDRTIAEDAIDKLRRAAANYRSTGQPFFSAVGFRKPHLPFRHPGVYDALYPDPKSIPLAKYKVLDASQPPIAYYQTGLAQNPYVPLPDAWAGTLRRDYYAAITWMDSQLSRVVAELYNQGLANDTLIVFHADHGWSLGEHGQWEKFTNFEHGTRVPLIISAPWIPGSAGTRTMALASLVDIFPTMASLAGVPAPESYGLEGQDLTPALAHAAQRSLEGRGIAAPVSSASSSGSTEPSASGLRNYTLSVYARCPSNVANASLFWQDNSCLTTERSEFPFFGMSIRTDRWRYTEWRRWNGTQLAPIAGGSGRVAAERQQRLGSSSSSVGDAAAAGAAAGDALIAVELYDHQGDDGNSFDGAYEVQNLAGNPSYATEQAQLAAQLKSVYPTWA